jgi:hypothetical protein
MTTNSGRHTWFFTSFPFLAVIIAGGWAKMAPKVGRCKCLASRPKPISKILFYWGFGNTFTGEIKLKTSK